MSASVLFDAPGPRARRRHLLLTAVGAVALLAILYVIIHKLADAQQLQGAMWKPFVTDGSLWANYLVPGLIGTAKAAVLAIVGAGLFGIVLGLGRLSQNRLLRWLSGIIVEFFRAVPVLLMMVFLYFGYFATSSSIPSSVAPLLAVVVALILYNGSVIAELVRSGIFGLPRGQREAGLSIGLTPSQTLRTIELPQALTAMLPALVSQLVVILKDSALGTAITYGELLTWSKTLGSSYANTVPAYIVCAALFITVNYGLTRLARLLQTRLARRGQSTTDAPPPPGTVAPLAGTASAVPPPA